METIYMNIDICLERPRKTTKTLIIRPILTGYLPDTSLQLHHFWSVLLGVGLHYVLASFFPSFLLNAVAHSPFESDDPYEYTDEKGIQSFGLQT
jgi:hypothetical protein